MANDSWTDLTFSWGTSSWSLWPFSQTRGYFVNLWRNGYCENERIVMLKLMALMYVKQNYRDHVTKNKIKNQKSIPTGLKMKITLATFAVAWSNSNSIIQLYWNCTAMNYFSDLDLFIRAVFQKIVDESNYNNYIVLGHGQGRSIIAMQPIATTCDSDCLKVNRTMCQFYD